MTVAGASCPCGADASVVIDSRQAPAYRGFTAIRRRRICASCRGRFTTIEVCIDALENNFINDRLGGQVGAEVEHALTTALDMVRKLRSSPREISTIPRTNTVIARPAPKQVRQRLADLAGGAK